LPLIIIREVITILVRLKKIIIGAERSAPIILFFKLMPTEERIAETKRQNSSVPVQRKLKVIGSASFETKIVDVFVTESKTKELLTPNKDNNALEEKPKK
jgi:hypothetical protein